MAPSLALSNLKEVCFCARAIAYLFYLCEDHSGIPKDWNGHAKGDGFAQGHDHTTMVMFKEMLRFSTLKRWSS